MAIFGKQSKAMEIPETQAAYQELLKEILAKIAAFEARFPEGSAGLADKVRAIVIDAVNGISPDVFKVKFIADVMALWAAGKGPAPHDPTELA